MSDPFSIAASAAGLVSLGLTVCSGLLDYYSVWIDQHSDVLAMCEALVSLKNIFTLLVQKLRHPLLDRRCVDQVTDSIVSCAIGVQTLQLKLDKIRNTKPGVRSHLQRAQYPFRQKTLGKLLETISELRSNLNLATSTLQLDVSTTSLNNLREVDTNIKKLIDDSQYSSSKILDGLSELHLGQKQEYLRALSLEERTTINWLSPLDHVSKHHDALNRRHKGTGQWFLESSEFRSWLDTGGSVLWCPGMPGAGKTILASTVFDYLHHTHSRERTGVAYVYCVYNGANHTASNLLGSLLQQLASHSVAVLEEIRSCHNRYASNGTRPDLNEIALLLRTQVEIFDEVFIVIDALDECSDLDQTRQNLLTRVRCLLPKARLMVTSRHSPSIEKMFKHDTRLEIRAQDQDVREFVKSQLEQRDELVDLLEDHEDVQSSIIATILKKTNGMFLLAALHMDSLAREDNIRDLKESLQRLPKDLEKTYDDALERIRHQDSRKLARAEQVLTLINCAKRPLQMSEMRQAISIRKGDTSLDLEALPKAESFISPCRGLVVVEDESQVVRLVHYTTDEYFKRRPDRYRSPEAHRYIAGVLVTYLSFTTFANFSIYKTIDDAMNERAEECKMSMTVPENDEKSEAVWASMERCLKDNVLVEYAAEYWGHHAREALTSPEDQSDLCLTTTSVQDSKADDLWDLKQLILEFLKKKHNIACANAVIYHVDRRLYCFDALTRGPYDVTNLHMAASIGIPYFVEHCLGQGADVDARDFMGMTALHKAAQYGHLEIVQLLLDSGASIALRDRMRRNALHWAVSANAVSVVQLLLQSGSDPGSERWDGNSTIRVAAVGGFDEIVQLLVGYEMNGLKRTHCIGDAMVEAAYNQHWGVVCLLLRAGTDWNISDNYITRALICASSEGHIMITKTLLEVGVDANSSLRIGGDALQSISQKQYSRPLLFSAVQNGHRGSVALLLENEADVNAPDSDGDTLMVCICRQSYRETSCVPTVQWLIENGADTAATDCDFNRTSLEWAVLQGDEELVRFLLQYESFSAARRNLMLYLARLYHAIKAKAHEAVDQLFRENTVRGLGSISEILLIYIPAAAGYEDIVRTFLQLRAAVDAKTPSGKTSLHLAAQAGHIAVVELLIDKAADINSRDSIGLTPLMEAASRGHSAMVQLLLDRGADIDAAPRQRTSASTAIALALQNSYMSIAKMLLERGANVDARYDQFGGTLLHLVFQDPRVWKIHLLLDNGADLEAEDIAGRTPLFVSVRRGPFDPKAVQALLERGANLEARDNYGHTALVEAARSGRLEAVQFLLERGADPHALPSAVTIENDWVYEEDFDKAVELVLEAQSKT